MDSIGFKIGSPLEEISRIKVGTPTAEHPVVGLCQARLESQTGLSLN